MTSLKELNRSLKNYDSYLYAVEHKLGRIDIYRKAKFSLAPPHFLFSLTDSWKVDGQSISYGIEVVLNRIKALDLWRDDSFVERYLKDHEASQESKKRDLRNSIESFLYDFRPQFQKATNGINTSTLKKLYRKENSHGFSEQR